VGEVSSIKSALKATLEHFSKPPSIIVNSAGITRDNFLLKLSHTDFDDVININLKVTIFDVKIKSILINHLRGHLW
jgi:NAD(P)-dependent dehydrogenase (short-subunit alcohol dehydrogenase family)